MAAFPEEPYGVAGFHQLRAPGFGMAAPGFDYSSSDSESTDSGFERGGSLSTDSDASDSDDSLTTATTTRRTLNDDEDWWRDGKAALDAAAAAAAPAEALAGAMR